MKYGESIGFVSEKKEKKVADFMTFYTKKHDLSDKKCPSVAPLPV
jgi:hypothetical protein